MDVALKAVTAAQGYYEALDNGLKERKFPLLEKAHEATKAPRALVVILAVLGFLGVVFFGFGAQFVLNLIGLVYPLFQTFKAIASDTKEDDKFWLKYWVCFATFTLVDSFGAILTMWIPMLLKAAMLVYLMDFTRGADFVYDSFLADMFKNYRPMIETAVESLSSGTAVDADPDVVPPVESGWEGAERDDAAVSSGLYKKDA